MRTIGKIPAAATMTDRFGESLEREGAIDGSPPTRFVPASKDQPETELDLFLDHLDEIDREQRHAERYGFDENDPYQMEQAGFDAPLVFELGNMRSLLANWAFVQSAMNIGDPDRLMLDYTRLMMGFLLFHASPRTIEIIGLGGGSLAKYCYRYLPEAAITAIEIDPEVIAVGERFLMPPEDDRFEIICEDGADFVRRDPRSCDILLVDGFDKDGQPGQLCSSAFYGACSSRLKPGGVFVANLCDHPWKSAAILARIRECFGTTIVVPVGGEMNQVVFAFKDRHPSFDRETIRQTARMLDQTHPMSFTLLAEAILDGPQAIVSSGPVDRKWRHLRQYHR